MVKKTLSIIILTSLILLTGCANKEISDAGKNDENSVVQDSEVKESEKSVDKENVDENKSVISDYITLESNDKYIYDGINSEYADLENYIDFLSEDRIQVRTNNGGTETVRVIENKNGQLKIIFKRDNCFYRENFMSKPSNYSEILLKEPLVKGTSWTLEDGSKRYITGIDIDVNTPKENYKGLEVTTERVNGEIDIHYYVKGKGLIKIVRDKNGMNVTSVLNDIIKDSRLSQSIEVYYPQVTETDYAIYKERKVLEISTNDITKSKIVELMRTKSALTGASLLTEGTTINSLYLNDDGMLYVDFNEKLVEEMNAGSGYEQVILSSIVNTLGQYYGVEKVYLTINNQPYKSGHIIKNKGEAFSVDLSKVTKN